MRAVNLAQGYTAAVGQSTTRVSPTGRINPEMRIPNQAQAVSALSDAVDSPPARPAVGFSSQVSINLDAVASNLRSIRSVVGNDVSLMAVVKANAYGHGAPQIARLAISKGADLLAVANINEALELRRAGIDAPILMLGFAPPEAIKRAIELDLSVTVFDREQARQYQSAAGEGQNTLSAHIKVDTGMGRLGVLVADADELCRRVNELPALKLEGIFTHLTSADSDAQYTAAQLSRFSDLLVRLEQSGIRFRYVHAANSAGILTQPSSHFNLARPGLLLYGLNPLGYGQGPDWLKPVMTWKTTIAQVKTLPVGSAVGYGNTYWTQGNERIAVLPVGYADGLRRSPRTWREVLVRGQRAPVVGRVSMEKTTINVSQIPGAQAGDEVVLLGKQGDDGISAEEIACWIGSINYEVVTAIAPRAPRYFVPS